MNGPKYMCYIVSNMFEGVKNSQLYCNLIHTYLRTNVVYYILIVKYYSLNICSLNESASEGYNFDSVLFLLWVVLKRDLSLYFNLHKCDAIKQNKSELE